MKKEKNEAVQDWFLGKNTFKSTYIPGFNLQ